ncbi:SDR family oxidoreductase [Phyllobacterium sp. TAF24]|uniref:SDR family oxidoreductase n=1 Tax=Phyllobacterium sp. TAF24 TaxID=3233068 RepID=UPI003F958366
MSNSGKETRVVLITGASSGIGKMCAAHLHSRGYRVYGTSRRAVVAGSNENGFTLIPMDVTSEQSIVSALEFIMAREGRIDIVINNAGNGIAGAIEDTTIAEAQAQLDTNFFGALRVCRNVLPLLRRQKRSYLINISSIGGIIGIPFQGLYSASKFAIEGMSEVLAAEVKPQGVNVVLVEPGDFRTGFSAERRIVANALKPTIYSKHCEAALKVMEADELGGSTPEPIARMIERIVNMRSPKLRYMVGPTVQKLSVSIFKKLLPQKLFQLFIMKYYKIA